MDRLIDDNTLTDTIDKLSLTQFGLLGVSKLVKRKATNIAAKTVAAKLAAYLTPIGAPLVAVELATLAGGLAKTHLDNSSTSMKSGLNNSVVLDYERDGIDKINKSLKVQKTRIGNKKILKKNMLVGALDTASNWVVDNPYKTAGIVAGAGAVSYGAYKLAQYFHNKNKNKNKKNTKNKKQINK